MVSADNAMADTSQHISGQESRQGAAAFPRAPTPAPRQALGANGREILAQAIAQDVIPQLVAMPWLGAARPAAAADAAPAIPCPAIDDDAVQRLVALCFEPEGQAVASFVAGLHRRGAAAETLYTDLLTPVARTLGVMWEEDECSFADVSIGMVRLQNAQRALAPSFVGKTPTAFGAPRALLLFPVPGEQHTFGLSIVMDFFLRAGWDAWLGVMDTEQAAIDLVRRERADLIGLSFACDERIDAAERVIAGLRTAAANRRLAIKVGADATATDGYQAVLVAHELLHAVAGPT